MTRPIAILLVCLAGVGCAGPVVTFQQKPTSEDRGIRRIALLPFDVGRSPVASRAPDDAASLVTARVLGALSGEEQFVVVPPDDVTRALDRAGKPQGPAARMAALEEAFGVQAYVSGQVQRFDRRVGGRSGAERPASVRFRMEMHGAGGRLLFRGLYDETQLGANERFGLAFQRGFRWLTAEQLASFGAGELVDGLVSALD